LIDAEKDIIAALLKTVHINELIPEAIYQGALNKLFCTFDAGAPLNYDGNTKRKGSAKFETNQ